MFAEVGAPIIGEEVLARKALLTPEICMEAFSSQLSTDLHRQEAKLHVNVRPRY